MKQSTKSLSSFYVVGISVRTTNANGKAANDLAALWQQFYQEGISDQISHKKGPEVYAVYTRYESDYRGAYTALIGCAVTTLEHIPEGMSGMEVKAQTYECFEASGKMPDAVVNAWQAIWDQDDELNRAYLADFEVYGAQASNPEDAVVPIYIGV